MAPQQFRELGGQNVKHGLVIEDGLRVEQSAELEVPAGYQPVALPAQEKHASLGLEAPFSVEPIAGGVRVRRTLAMKMGKFPKEDYPELWRTLRLFGDARKKVLTFERRPAP
ncbi:MAG: hypothetical protein HYZ28_24650 [Myxococcales bacterium]|nr:hypothetical protein [Myxococcales bacterium]